MPDLNKKFKGGDQESFQPEMLYFQPSNRPASQNKYIFIMSFSSKCLLVSNRRNALKSSKQKPLVCSKNYPRETEKGAIVTIDPSVHGCASRGKGE